MVLVNAAASELDCLPCGSQGTKRTPPVYVSPTPHEVPKRSFTESLMCLLLDDEYSQILTFLPDGLSFGIINSKVFADDVMPNVFGIRNVSSFVRKLHRWGFERILDKKTHNVDVFRHPLFRKGDWASCQKIKCCGRQRQRELPATDEVVQPLIARQQQIHGSNFTASTTVALLSHSWDIQSMHAVTSQVVGAALQALKSDEALHAPTDLQHTVLYQRTKARLMALQNR